MGIDTPAFSRGVERPSDTASERGRVFNEAGGDFLNPGDSTTRAIHTNSTDSLQFMLLANVHQITNVTVTAQTPVEVGFRVVDPFFNERFEISVSDRPIVESLPQLPIEPDDSIEVTADNQSGSDIAVRGNFTLRQS